MKKLLPLLAVGALMSCSSPEKSAQKLISSHLEQNLKDPKSYEPVGFGSLDSTFSSINDNLEYRNACAKYDVMKEKFDEYMDEYKLYSKYGVSLDKQRAALDAAGPYLKKCEELTPYIDSIASAFKPEFNGWVMTHKFRAKNGFGALDLSEVKFYFDKELTTIQQEESLE